MSNLPIKKLLLILDMTKQKSEGKLTFANYLNANSYFMDY